MSEPQRENHTPESAAFAGRRGANSRILGTIVALVAMLVTVYAVEIGLLLREHWVAYSEPKLALTAPSQRARWLAMWKAAEDAGAPFDERSTAEMFADLAAEGVAAYQPSYGAAYIARRLTLDIDGVKVVPLGGISRAHVLFCNRDGGYLTYESDEHGFRNPPGLYDSDSLQVAIVGDSFAIGMCIGDEDHAAALVREAYPRTLTFGIPGFGPLAIGATLVEYAAHLEPPTVLWFFFEGNDLDDLEREMRHQLLPRYLEEGFSQGLWQLQTPIDGALRSFDEQEKGRLTPGQRAVRNLRSWKSMMLLQNLRLALAPLLARSGAERAPFREDVLRQILQRSHDRVASWDGRMHFVYLPAFERYANPQAPPPHREAVLRLVDEIGIPVIDVHRAFQAHPKPTGLFPFGLSGHYNEAGNRIVAKTILEALAARP